MKKILFFSLILTLTTVCNSQVLKVSDCNGKHPKFYGTNSDICIYTDRATKGDTAIENIFSGVITSLNKDSVSIDLYCAEKRAYLKGKPIYVASTSIDDEFTIMKKIAIKDISAVCSPDASKKITLVLTGFGYLIYFCPTNKYIALKGEYPVVKDRVIKVINGNLKFEE